MRPKLLSIAAYAAADADSVALSQTPAAGGIQSLTLNGTLVSGGVATMDVPRQIAIASAADDSGRIFVVTGTDIRGNPLIEAVVGANAGAASTVQRFATVTQVEVDADTAGAVTVGQAATLSTDWYPLNYTQRDFQVSLSIFVGAATADLSVQLTLSKLLSRRGNSPLPTVGNWYGGRFDFFYPTVVIQAHDTLVNVTADATGNIAFPVTAVRLLSNAQLTGGNVSMEIVQAHGG